VYTPPDSFVEKLEREFRGRLRVRWSRERNEWHIEQKIKRGLFPGTKPSKRGWDETADAYIRHRDGTIFVMAVRTGSLMDCPRCGTELKVPYMETHFVRCPLCQLRGYTNAYPVVFFPLGDGLIDYLRKIDPENPLSERLNEDLERQNELLAETMERDALRLGEAAAHERYNRIVGIPQTGWTQATTKMWQR
jgi:hypothetical protein